MVARPCSAVRSPVTFISAEPYAQLARAGRRWRRRCPRTPPRSRAPGPARWRGRSTRGWSATGWTGRRPGRTRPASTLGARIFSASSSGICSSSPSQSQPVPGQVLPAAPDRRREGAHRVELAARRVHGDRGQLRMQPHPLLGGARCPRCRRRTCSPGRSAARRPHGRRPSAASSRALHSASSAALLRRPARRTDRSRTTRPRSGRRAPARRPAPPARPDPAAAITLADSFAIATACEATLRRRVHASGPRRTRTPRRRRAPPAPRTRGRWCPTIPAGLASRSRQEALRTRSSRKSACSAPSARARASAASASARSGSARKASSMAWGTAGLSLSS